jgi:DNA-binding NarL/FixJ family response regulator
MPRMTGLQAAEQIRKRRPETKVLLLSMYDSEQYLFAAVRAGASGYLLKSAADEEVAQACRTVSQGGPFLYPSSTSTRAREYFEHLRKGVGAPSDVLTPREQEILKLVAEGHSSDEIGSMLTISIKTVERHRANLMDKLEIRDRPGLTRYAIRRGLVEP